MPTERAQRPSRSRAFSLFATCLCGGSLLGGSSVPEPAWAEEQEPPRIEITESSNPKHGDPEAIEQGLQTYMKFCRQCHGPKADGAAPRFGDYSGDLRKFWRGYGEFVAIVLNGRPKKQMPPWVGILDQDDIANIGAFLETLAIEGAVWK
ncbi:MAG: c-type cytochrome [Gammaproteobacteria bacterium]